jgi:hypothetical protein
VIHNSKDFAERQIVCRALKFVAILAVLTVLSIVVSGQVYADDSRIHITFLKGAYGSGSGYLFFQGQKYGLGISSPKVRRVWVTAIDLIGTASNLRNAADIIGTYTAVDAEAATVSRSKMAHSKIRKE